MADFDDDTQTAPTGADLSKEELLAAIENNHTALRRLRRVVKSHPDLLEDEDVAGELKKVRRQMRENRSILGTGGQGGGGGDDEEELDEEE